MDLISVQDWENQIDHRPVVISTNEHSVLVIENMRSLRPKIDERILFAAAACSFGRLLAWAFEDDLLAMQWTTQG
jgi:hypothetical protein